MAKIIKIYVLSLVLFRLENHGLISFIGLGYYNAKKQNEIYLNLFITHKLFLGSSSKLNLSRSQSKIIHSSN